MYSTTASTVSVKRTASVSNSVETRRLAKRRQMLALQAASYSLGSSVLLVYSFAGITPFAAPALFFLGGIAITAVFVVLSETGFSDRFSDHFLTIPQVSANLSLQLSFLVEAPEMGIMFLCVMFVTFGFAALRMSRSEATILLVVTGVAVTAIFLQLRSPLMLPLATRSEALAGVLMFVVTVGQCVYIGLFGNSMRQTLQRRSDELRVAYQRIEELAQTDELTGLPNRRAIITALEEETLRGQRGDSFSVAIIDLDWFKRINDTFGHPVGDDVLKTFAMCMLANTRLIDKLGRYGGEEFLLILPHTNQIEAKRLVDRLRTIIEHVDWSSLTSEKPVTFSAGVANFAMSDCADTVLDRADKALYAAKERGRNQVVINELNHDVISDHQRLITVGACS